MSAIKICIHGCWPSTNCDICRNEKKHEYNNLQRVKLWRRNYMRDYMREYKKKRNWIMKESGLMIDGKTDRK